MSDEVQISEDEFEAAADDPAIEMDIETPEADAAEQHTDVVHRDDVPAGEDSDSPVASADPADVAEQRRVVNLDEEDYR
ncbi:hypothetical protein G3I60_14010 [Streptomyces sp. SID13666]|uniref:hypothetical protein n=1 Tax=Streptomyces TaxID=1883 RepID=UPI001106F2B4|nr:MULTISPECIES: hypothetical protein [Streptomyces]MCZ4098113.1 hypothetical protein [Streptomyces sp. H39-C1]NEA55233.1 hypothetical protein [Streptomyces sp. SID13666]NEA73439.1 hypothetical protein [Streptomyces sp. SID13588]QNA75162.1 hypothetical protein C8250_027625 [Streptomyces sp. So13.3]